jgi:chitodextrinase
MNASPGQMTASRHSSSQPAAGIARCCAVIMTIAAAQASAQTNIAPGGTAYRWAHNTQATANTNRVAAAGLNDGNSTVDVNLSGGKGETQTRYEAGGIVWSHQQTLTSVQFVNGSWASSNDGAFCDNLSLQTTLDGKTWTSSTWTLSPQYAFDSGAAAGVRYVFSGNPLPVLGVRISGEAHCPGHNSDWANVREILAFSNDVDTIPPSAPTHLTGVASSHQINLTWSGSTDNVGVARYQIFRNGATKPTGTSTTTSYADTSVAPNTSYSYVVRAVDAAGNVSTGSNVAQLSTMATAPDLALAGTAYRWDHNLSATADSNRTPAPGLNDGNTTVDVNLSDGPGETATLYEAGGVLWTSAQTVGQVEFVAGTWESSNDGAFCSGLTLQTTADGTTWSNTSWPVSPAYPYDRPGAAGITYTFTGTPVTVLGVRISGQTHCAGGNSDWANVREVLALGNGSSDTTPPSAPGSLTASATSATQVALAWTASTDNIGVTGYLIYRNGNLVTTVGASVLSYQDNGLSASTSYSYFVEAEDATGNLSAASNVVPVTTPADTVGNCTPDIAIPSTGGRTWPDSCTTGASNSLGVLRNVSGDITLDQPGQVYSNMRVDGSITVLACDVKLENVEVDAGVPFTGDSTPDVFPIWLKQPANCQVTLDHVSVITRPAPNVYVTNAIRVAYGGPVTITNSKIIGTQLGITTGPGLIRDNYAVLGSTLRGDHNEVILEDGTEGLTIAHNTFLNPNLQTSVLSLFTEFGANSNITVDSNLMAGGGYTCYCGDGATDNAGNPARAMNVSFTNNVFWRLYYPDVGYYGSGRAYNSAGGGQWMNNLYMNADGTLTSQQVPQPPIDGQ